MRNDSPTPSPDTKYGALVESFRRDILGGKYPPDRPLPSERALIRRFGISRNTVQHAFAELESLGLIRRSQGRGTFATKIGSSRLIGVVVPGTLYSSKYFQRVFATLAEIAQRNDYSIMLEGVWTDDPVRNRQSVDEMADRLISRRVAGVVYHPISQVTDAEKVNIETLAALTRAKIPSVLVVSDVVKWPDRSMYDLVTIDNIGAGMQLAEHLYSNGAKNLYFLMLDNPISNLYNRIRGVEMVSVSRLNRSWPRSRIIKTETITAGFVANLMRRRPKPDAFICQNDRIAHQVRVCLVKLGFAVPAEVQIAGFDDMPFSDRETSEITTISQPCEAIATEAFLRLIARLNDPSLPFVKKLLPYAFVARASTRNSKGLPRRS